MASELQLQGSLKFTKGGAVFDTVFAAALFDVAGSVGTKVAVAVGITDETLALGDVTSIGYVALKNLDATNPIHVGSDGTLYPIILRPGGWFIGEWNAAAIHVKAITAPCNLEGTIITE